jgi:hypothetical protein
MRSGLPFCRIGLWKGWTLPDHRFEIGRREIIRRTLIWSATERLKWQSGQDCGGCRADDVRAAETSDDCSARLLPGQREWVGSRSFRMTSSPAGSRSSETVSSVID